MLDTRLTEDQQSLRKTVEAFAHEVVAPVAVARQHRDSKILEIGEGASEVQLMLIARELGL